MGTTPLYIHPHSMLLPGNTTGATTSPAGPKTAGAPAMAHVAIATAKDTGSSTFGNILDTLNPLQHIPVASTVYRSMTGSKISPGAQIAGDALYGALLGGGTLIAAAISGAASAADAGVQNATGTGIAGHVLTTLGITPPALTASTSSADTATATAHFMPLGSTTQSAAAPATSPTTGTAGPTSSTSITASSSWRYPMKEVAHYQRAKVLDSAHQYLASMGTSHAVRKSAS